MTVSYQLMKLDLRGRSYVATTQEGEVVLDVTHLAGLLGGKKGLDLCAAVNEVAKAHALLVDKEGAFIDREALLAELRAKAKPAKAAKTYRCQCGTAVAKQAPILYHKHASVLGCGECATIEVPTEKKRPAEALEVPGQDDFRVVLDGEYDHCLDHVKRTRAAFLRYNKDRLFRTGVQPGISPGSLVYLRAIDGTIGMQAVEDYNTLIGLLKTLSFGRYKEDKETGEHIWLPTAPPQGIVTHMLAHKDENVPVLSGLVRLPVLTPDGEVLTEQGYDPISRVYLAPDVKLEPLPEHISEEDLAAAKAHIDWLLTDFPFLTPADKSAAIGCMIDQVARASLIEGATPAYCFSAPNGGEGTGKSLLAEVIACIMDGGFATTSWASTEEELSKQLLPLIEAQRFCICFDNVNGFVASPTLDSAITSGMYETRRLGRNSMRDMVRVPLRSSIMFTSNGATFHNSMARRMVMIQQDAKLRKTGTAEEDYTVPNIKVFVRNKRNRAHIVRCLMVIVKWWLQHGRPKDKDIKVLPSFESWSAIVPSIVRFAGWPCMNPAMYAASNDANADKEEARLFINAWFDRFGFTAIRASALGEIAIDGGFYVNRMKVSSKTASPAYVGRSINMRWMGFLKRWPVQVPDGRLVQVQDGPREVGQPTWHLEALPDPRAIPEPPPSFEPEYLDGFDPDGVDPFAPPSILPA